MFPANGSVIKNGVLKSFSDDTKILGYDPVIMPALIQAELPLVIPINGTTNHYRLKKWKSL
jgi:hypothetical protein